MDLIVLEEHVSRLTSMVDTWNVEIRVSCEAESFLDMPGFRDNGEVGQSKMVGGGDNERCECSSEHAVCMQS
jgi:hypothetical protein